MSHDSNLKDRHYIGACRIPSVGRWAGMTTAKGGLAWQATARLEARRDLLARVVCFTVVVLVSPRF